MSISIIFIYHRSCFRLFQDVPGINSYKDVRPPGLCDSLKRQTERMIRDPDAYHSRVLLVFPPVPSNGPLLLKVRQGVSVSMCEALGGACAWVCVWGGGRCMPPPVDLTSGRRLRGSRGAGTLWLLSSGEAGGVGYDV